MESGKEQVPVAAIKLGDILEHPRTFEWVLVVDIEEGTRTSETMRREMVNGEPVQKRHKSISPYKRIKIQKMDLPELDRVSGFGCEWLYYEDVEGPLNRKIRPKDTP